MKTAAAAAEAQVRLALPLAVTLRLSESLSQAGAGQGLSRTQALARGSLATNTLICDLFNAYYLDNNAIYYLTFH